MQKRKHESSLVEKSSVFSVRAQVAEKADQTLAIQQPQDRIMQTMWGAGEDPEGEMKMGVSKKHFLEDLRQVTGVTFERRTIKVRNKATRRVELMRAWVGSNHEVHPTFAGIVAKYRKMVEKKLEQNAGRRSAENNPGSRISAAAG